MSDLSAAYDGYFRAANSFYRAIIDFYVSYEWQRHRYRVLNLHDIPADTLCPYEDPR